LDNPPYLHHFASFWRFLIIFDPFLLLPTILLNLPLPGKNTPKMYLFGEKQLPTFVLSLKTGLAGYPKPPDQEVGTQSPKSV
jgi:hypothetical protein